MRVALRNDLLTIHAHDAPLAEVLRAVHGLTGVSIEGVASASERVTLEVGPMRVKDAVIAVLDRSQCDYVLVSSVRLPERLERVVVSVRRTSDAAPRSTAMSEDDQRHLIDGRKSVASRTTSGIDRAKEQGRQERRFDRMFGACITQGCDAS